jgi:hypothetical protein
MIARGAEGGLPYNTLLRVPHIGLASLSAIQSHGATERWAMPTQRRENLERHSPWFSVGFLLLVSKFCKVMRHRIEGSSANRAVSQWKLQPCNILPSVGF